MSATIDIEALKAERRAELARIIDAYAARTLDIVSLMIRGDVTKDARTEANARARREALDAIFASDASLIARTEAAEAALATVTGCCHRVVDLERSSRAELIAQRDRLVEALRRINQATPGNTNSGNEWVMASWTQAVAATALADLPAALSATTPEQSA